MHYVCKLKNDNEIGHRDVQTAKLLLKYGANPNLETAEVFLFQNFKTLQNLKLLLANTNIQNFMFPTLEHLVVKRIFLLVIWKRPLTILV